MGYTKNDPIDYQNAVTAIDQTGQTFHRSATARASGNYGNIAEILDPRKLKDGMRECCFAPGFDDALPIIISIDATGSMEQVPYVIREGMPNLIGLITEQGVSDHPNIMFMCHDDEHAVPPDAAFQMSQFETGADELVTSLNELVFPGHGAGNSGEGYHLPIYAAAHHTRIECFERDKSKGFFFLIGDEEPYYYNGDPSKNGTTPEIAREVFGDKIEKTVTMLEALKKLAERYHVFVIRPGHTSHGKDASISQAWKKLLKAAGINTEHVIEIAETEAIIPTMALTIGAILGADRDEMAEVLRTNGVGGVDQAAQATMAIVPVTAGASAGKTTGALVTTTGTQSGRKRR